MSAEQRDLGASPQTSELTQAQTVAEESRSECVAVLDASVEDMSTAVDAVQEEQVASELTDVESCSTDEASEESTRKPKRRRRRSRAKSRRKKSAVSERVDETLESVSEAIESCVDATSADLITEPEMAQEASSVEPSTVDSSTEEAIGSADVDAIEDPMTEIPATEIPATVIPATEIPPVEEIAEEMTLAELIVDPMPIDEAPIEDINACMSEVIESAEPQYEEASTPPSENSSAKLEEIIATNTAVLQQVVEHISQVRSELAGAHEEVDATPRASSGNDADLISEIEKLGSQIDDLYQQLDDAQVTNRQLEADLAQARAANAQPVQSAAALSPSGPLTWEQRKEQMLKEMEEDSFDAESFVETIQSTATPNVEAELLDLAPEEYVVQLNLELERVRCELESRDEEVAQLQQQLQNHSSDALRALKADTAIEDLVDVDSLLQDERERLQKQQKECEERLRESEVATSLERARLSRERRELARQNAELEEQLIHIRRENEADQKSGGKGSRRWLAILGLSED
jgi:hypothetical protein